MGSLPVRDALRTLILRELRAVRREIERYPDDATVWRAVPGIPNTAGTLALHLAGNLQHFLGAALAGDGYVRDRDAEFSRRDVPRDELLAEVDRAREAVAVGMDALTDDALAGEYPEAIGGRTFVTADMLVHLAAHLAYHLGQLDYHRRIVTGDGRTVNAVAAKDLPVR